MRYDGIAGWSSLVARWAHNPKVGGSNPPPATKTLTLSSDLLNGVQEFLKLWLGRRLVQGDVYVPGFLVCSWFPSRYDTDRRPRQLPGR